MFTLKTKSGHTHNYITNYEKWGIDENFIEFNQFFEGKYTLLIIHISDILYISEN